MNVVTYALMAYGMTAVISLGVGAIIVLINKVFTSSEEEETYWIYLFSYSPESVHSLL